MTHEVQKFSLKPKMLLNSADEETIISTNQIFNLLLLKSLLYINVKVKKY